MPAKASQIDKVYSSPPSRSGIGSQSRPGEARGATSQVGSLGSTGPDAGYAFKLVDHFRDRLQTGKVETKDAIAGCVAVAMKRAALYGRAPVSHDLEAAFNCFGFMTSSASPDLVAMREPLFAGVANHHHYSELRELVDIVLTAFLMQSPDQIKSECAENWKAPFVFKNY